jgi:hypothetical protein
MSNLCLHAVPPNLPYLSVMISHPHKSSGENIIIIICLAESTEIVQPSIGFHAHLSVINNLFASFDFLSNVPFLTSA